MSCPDAFVAGSTTFVELPATFAGMSVTFAEPSVTFAELPATFAELPATFTELSATFAEPSANFAEPSATFAEPSVNPKFLWFYFSNYETSTVFESSFEATCRRNLAPIVAAARCFVSGLGKQRLQRIAGRRWDEK